MTTDTATETTTTFLVQYEECQFGDMVWEDAFRPEPFTTAAAARTWADRHFGTAQPTRVVEVVTRRTVVK
jgi:hypothetical protein